MTSTISFRNLESLSHLRDFVDGYLEQTIGHLNQNRPITANVVIEKKRVKRNSHGHPDFVCEIVLHHPDLKRAVVARKSSPNFYQSVKDTCRAVERAIRRLVQARSRRRHKNFDRDNRLEVLNQIKDGSGD